MYPANYELVREAVIGKRVIEATYHGRRRKLCPHVIGRNRSGRRQGLFYQFDGGSAHGIGPIGSPSNWRCIPIDEMTDVRVVEGDWHTAENHSRPQTCVVEIDVQATL